MKPPTLFDQNLGEIVRKNGPHFAMLEYETELKKLRDEASLYKHKYAGKCNHANKKTK